MRISKKLCALITAGCLTFSLGIGGVALADTPAADTATTAEEMVYGSVFKTSGTDKFIYRVATDLLAEETLENGYFDGAYLGVNGIAYVSIANESTIGQEEDLQAIAQEDVEFMVLDAGGEDIVFADPIETIIDANFVYTYPFTFTVDGDAAEGRIVLYFAPDATASVAIAYTVDEANPTDPAITAIADSLTYVGNLTVATGTPAPTTAPAGANEFDCDGWHIVAHPESVVTDVVESTWEDEDGVEVVGIPLTFTNNKDQTSDPAWDLYYTRFGPDGIAMDDYYGSYFDDAFNGNSKDMRRGSTHDFVVYFENVGDGIYAVEFESWETDEVYAVEFEFVA